MEEEQQASSLEVDQQNPVLPSDQVGSTSEERPIPTESAQGSGANRLKPVLGYAFEPKDSELISYLNGKIQGKELHDCGIFQEVKFYKYEPEELTGTKHPYVRGDEWYFFTQREVRGTRKGKRIFERETRHGSWQALQGEKIIVDKGRIIGYRRPLQYFREKERTRWMMIEYRSTLTECTVICRVYRIRDTGIIPDLNKSLPKAGGKAKKRRFGDAPQAAPSGSAEEAAAGASQDRESQDAEIKQERADDFQPERAE